MTGSVGDGEGTGRLFNTSGSPAGEWHQALMGRAPRPRPVGEPVDTVEMDYPLESIRRS